MTPKDQFLLEFYNVVEKIDENEFIKGDFLVHMKKICTLFKKYGLCENKEGKEDE